MILVDTSVIVDFLRSPTTAMLEWLRDNEAAICGVTRAEVLAGVRNQADLRRVSASLDALGQVPVSEAVWQALGRNLFALRAAGTTVPFADALIATVAVENDLSLWARDAHYPRIQAIVTALRLFPEPK
jgi:predicted nucleic acid-binding protein